jgi:hypothetical protein
VDVWIHVFLTLALVGGEWSDSRPGRFNSGERAPGTHYGGGWVAPEPVCRTCRRENSWPYRDSNTDSSLVQPVARLPFTYLCIHLFIYTLIQSETLKTCGYVGRITCKWECGLDLSGSRYGSMAGSWGRRQWPFGFRKRWGISWILLWLLALKVRLTRGVTFELVPLCTNANTLVI